MALDPRIALQGRVPDIGRTFSNALMNVQRFEDIRRGKREAPARQRLLEAQAGAAEAAVPTSLSRFNEAELNRIKSIAVGAQQIIPDLQAGNIDRVRASLQQRGAALEAANIPRNDTDEALRLLETNPAELLRISQEAVKLAAPAAKVAQTPLIKNLIAAGFTPGTPEFREQVLKGMKKAPLVQVGGGKAEQKELAKLRAQDLKSLRAKGSEAEEQLTSLDILENIDVSTGAAEPMKQSIAAFAEGFGVDASPLVNVAAGQSFTAEAGKVVLRVLATQKGPQTDNDRKHIAKTISRLGNSPEANVFINNAARATASRTIEQRDFFNEWLDKNDTLKGAASAWNKLKRDIPMVSRFVKTAGGLPVFFFRFRERVQEANPGASLADIKEAWLSQEQAAKAGRK